MGRLIILVALTSAVILTAAAPSSLNMKNSRRPLKPIESRTKDKLHEPWMQPEVPPTHPRKGEYPCKTGICKVKAGTVSDCGNMCQIPLKLR